MTQDSTEERRRKHMAVMDDGKADWQSEAMRQNALLHDAMTRAEVAEAKLAKAVAALLECQEELDLYSKQEYPLDHPVHERYRKRDFDANPARIALAEIKGE